MRKGLFHTKEEYIFFGEENRLKVFQPNTFNFKPKAHIKLDEVQRCILDNSGSNIPPKERKRDICFQS